jgi:hypothetical protein
MANNILMSTVTLVPPQLVHDVEQALELAAKGVRDPEKMRQAREDMNRMREELRLRIGTVEAAVDLIRDARNQ